MIQPAVAKPAAAAASIGHLLVCCPNDDICGRCCLCLHGHPFATTISIRDGCCICLLLLLLFLLRGLSRR